MRSDITCIRQNEQKRFHRKIFHSFFFFFILLFFLFLSLSLLNIIICVNFVNKGCQVFGAKKCNRSIVSHRFHRCIECIEFSKSKVKEIEMKVMQRWNVTLFTRKIKKRSRHPPLQGSDSRPARKIGKLKMENDGSISNLESRRISLSTDEATGSRAKDRPFWRTFER